MGFNFPNAPTLGQLYPVPAVVGQPVYKWDGEKWTTQGAPLNKTPVYTDGSTPMTAQLTLIAPPVAPTDAVAKSYVDGGAGGTLVRTDVAQGLTAAQQAQGRQNIYAAPFDAMAYNGMQLNGGMEIDQEHNGTAVTVAGAYVLDGWYVSKVGTMVTTAQQVADAPPGYSRSLKVTVGTAEPALGSSDYLIVQQVVEGYRALRLAFGNVNAQPLSIGFYVKAHRTGSYSGSVRNSDSSRCYPFLFQINAADTWEWKAITVPGDTTGSWLPTLNGAGLLLVFAMAVGSGFAGAPGVWGANFLGATGSINGVAATSDIFQVTGVVMLPGIELPSAARAPFIMRPYDQELLVALRYYERIGMRVVVTSPPYGNAVWYKVVKRVAPTLTLVGGTANGAIVQNQTSNPEMGMSQTGAASAAADSQWAVDARL